MGGGMPGMGGGMGGMPGMGGGMGGMPGMGGGMGGMPGMPPGGMAGAASMLENPAMREMMVNMMS